MKKGILYIFHGSRRHQSNKEAIQFFHSSSKLAPISIQHYSFLELAAPTIEEGFEKCVDNGATEISVVPVLLFSAGHAKKDIPNVLIKLKKKYPQVTIRYGQPLGVHEAMIDVIEEKIDKAIKVFKLKNQNIKFIIIGRGSKDEEMQRDFQQMAQMVERRLGQKTEYCFLTAAKPLFQDVLKNLTNEHDETIVFVPYLLFTGLLLKGIERELQKSNKSFFLTEHIGQHHNVQQLVVTRALEAFLESPIKEENKNVKRGCI